MQPYFLPYIGYFQLMNSVDTFVVYDNIQYTKKGWINRNRMLVNGADQYFTLPLKKDSDYLNINERYLSDDSLAEKKKLANKIKGAYSKAPSFHSVYPVITEILLFDSNNLFDFIFNSLATVKDYLGIETELIKSTNLDFNIENYKSEEKVLKICQSLNASVYVNAIGGVSLYSGHNFKERGIELVFIESEQIEYPQFENTFVPWLSIVDVLMFNSKGAVIDFLSRIKTHI